ncbi:TM1266 family iron-only hydrogenase system putative regulator [Intestinibacter sp.]|uniref:TM1266 family iron-only hydrogenase system putative regulator n=1 Tax=Intestinibacter sp. TaxID=1965304 RepID=UPI003F16B0F0
MILSVENGCFAYKNSKDKLLLENINFSVEPGDFVAILGPNGAGKTTLLRCIMGFLKWKSGKSTLDGVDIRSISHKKLWKDIAYVPQAKTTVAAYTVEEMVLLGRSSHFGMLSMPKEKDLEIVNRVMDEMNLTRFAKKKCSQLSGGELQMVLIARALVSEPKILILDEPESNLDFKNQLLILDTMTKLSNQGISCIFNTHYPTHALQRANKAFLLSKSGKYLFGETREVITEENIEKAFGVKAVIGEIETPSNVLKDVIPLEITNTSDLDVLLDKSELSDERKVAVVSIIAEDSSISDKINKLIGQNKKYIIGRMGMPYEEKGISIINVTLDAPEHAIQSLVTQLGHLSGVSVKAIYSQVDFKEEKGCEKVE